MHLELDGAKDEPNQRRHGISFSEARELFEGGSDYLEIYDAAYSDHDSRNPGTDGAGLRTRDSAGTAGTDHA